MDRSSLARWAPLTGILAPLLWFVGVSISEKNTPDDGATAEEILPYFQNETNGILLGGVLFLLGTVLFIVFATVLRDRWRAAGAADGTVALGYVSAVVGAAFLAATWAPQIGVAVAIDDMGAPVSAAAAESAWHSGTGFFVVGEMILALFLFAAAAIAMRTAVLPAWLGWFAILLGIVALIPPIGWAAMIFGLPLWLLITSIVLMITNNRTPSTV